MTNSTVLRSFRLVSMCWCGLENELQRDIQTWETSLVYSWTARMLFVSLSLLTVHGLIATSTAVLLSMLLRMRPTSTEYPLRHTKNICLPLPIPYVHEMWAQLQMLITPRSYDWPPVKHFFHHCVHTGTRERGPLDVDVPQAFNFPKLLDLKTASKVYKIP